MLSSARGARGIRPALARDDAERVVVAPDVRGVGVGCIAAAAVVRRGGGGAAGIMAVIVIIYLLYIGESIVKALFSPKRIHCWGE